MGKIIKAPESYPKAVFLAGSIEMGAAEDWQTKATELLDGFTILNPRRDDWDSSWEQTIDNPQFREQVEWELEAMERADAILVYFDPATKSPITLLELGLWAKGFPSQKMVVVCPDGFWRKGNVDIVCKRYRVKTAYTLDTATILIKEFLA